MANAARRKNNTERNSKKSRNVEIEAPRKKRKVAKKTERRGRPAGMTAEQSAERGEKIVKFYKKNGSYKETAEHFGVSYAAVYQRVNYV